MASDPFANFNEEEYLAANPDIRDAVSKGVVKSGLAHYRRFGRHERRAGSPASGDRPPYRPLDAIPPEALRVRVTGLADLTSFDVIGRSICDDILDVAMINGVNLAPDARVLDFGCGCGRVLRHFAPQCPAQFYAVDIDAEAIEWCHKNFGAGIMFHRSPEWPPLPFANAQFDFLYAISVFTHLPEDMQMAWLAELSRIAKPGALLLLSVHAPDLLPVGNSVAAAEMDEQGFSYVHNQATDGLPEFYRTAFHAESYVRNQWGKLFQIEAVIRHGIADFQDLVVARAREPIIGESQGSPAGSEHR